MVIDEIKAAVGPNWPQVVLGFSRIEPGLLDGKQHPCPVCGAGRDRFRVLRDGRYFCQWCRTETGGWGDWLDLIVGTTNLTLSELVRELARRYAVSTPRDNRPDPQEAAQALWEASRPAEHTMADNYLHGRGLITPPELRYNASVYENNGGRRIPAMLAAVTSPRGDLVTVHRTYLTAQHGRAVQANMDNPKRVMPTSGMGGAAIRLFNRPGARTILVAEGIETAIAARLLRDDDIPAYSLISTSGMKSFIPPDEVESVLIYGDNDLNAAGQAAAWALCAKLRGRGIECPDPRFPTTAGEDWADVWAREAS